MHQEMVIVEIQKDGIRVETIGVLSKEAIEKEKQKLLSQIEIE
jgi:primase-polymerase (primpol)-like protein